MAFALNYQPLDAALPVRVAQVPWDSEALGLDVWDVDAGTTEPTALSPVLANFVAGLTGPSLVVARAPIDDVARHMALTACGFYPVEATLEPQVGLRFVTPVASRLPEGLVVRPGTVADLALLTPLAMSAFVSDRFHLDPNLDNAAADARYAGWLQRALQAGDTVWVLAEAATDRACGFFHVRPVDAKTIGLMLAAVDAPRRLVGAGPALYQQVLERCRDAGFRFARTKISLANPDALDIYAKLGFRLGPAQLTFHRFVQA